MKNKWDLSSKTSSALKIRHTGWYSILDWKLVGTLDFLLGLKIWKYKTCITDAMPFIPFPILWNETKQYNIQLVLPQKHEHVSKGIDSPSLHHDMFNLIYLLT
jgi:hypothetical protein